MISHTAHQGNLLDLAGEAFDLVPDERLPWLEQQAQGDVALIEEVLALVALMEDAEPIQGLESIAATYTQGDAPDEDWWRGKALGQYLLLEKLGEGGMGMVFLGMQTKPVKREVALKIIKYKKEVAAEEGDELFPQYMGLSVDRTLAPFWKRSDEDDHAMADRVGAEPQVLAMFNHPYIAQIYEANQTEDGILYFAIEYVEGQSITTFSEQKQLDLNERLNLFLKVCQGVQHAHRKAVLHLDLKPNNILVREIDHVAMPKIIDFGIALSADPEGDFRRQHHLNLGTPLYMSPEALANDGTDLDTRADVYALGIILFELLTGQRPSLEKPAKNEGRLAAPTIPVPSDICQQIQGQTSIGHSGARLARMMKPELDAIVAKATHRDREKRYESPADLAQDIQRFLEGRLVEAVPTSISYKARKLVSRYRGIMLASVVILSVILGSLFSLIQANRYQADALAKSQKTIHFLGGMIGTTPTGELDKISLKEFLDRCRRRLNHNFPEPGRARSDFLLIMGTAYLKIGEYDAAGHSLDEVFEYYQSNGLIDDSIAWPIWYHCAELHFLQGKHDEAKTLLDKALEIADRPTTKEPNYYSTQLLLARVRAAQGQLEPALATCQELLGHPRGVIPPPLRKEIGDTLVEMLRVSGKEAEALVWEEKLEDSAKRPPR